MTNIVCLRKFTARSRQTAPLFSGGDIFGIGWKGFLNKPEFVIYIFAIYVKFYNGKDRRNSARKKLFRFIRQFVVPVFIITALHCMFVLQQICLSFTRGPVSDAQTSTPLKTLQRIFKCTFKTLLRSKHNPI